MNSQNTIRGWEWKEVRQILDEIDQGTLPNLVFTDEKKFDIQQVFNQQNDRVWGSSSSVKGRIATRRQYPQSVMIWAAVTQSVWNISCWFLCLRGWNLTRNDTFLTFWNLTRYPGLDKHFQGLPWSLQQDSAPSHDSKMIQTWIQRKIPSFISKELLWPARSPDLNPLDFSIWSISEAKVSAWSSLFSWCSEGKTGEGMGRNPSRAEICMCRLWCICGYDLRL